MAIRLMGSSSRNPVLMMYFNDPQRLWISMCIYFQLLDLYLAPQHEPGPKLSARVWRHMLVFVT